MGWGAGVFQTAGTGSFDSSSLASMSTTKKEDIHLANEGLVAKPNGHMAARVSAASCIEGVGMQGRVERVLHTKIRHRLFARETNLHGAVVHTAQVCE